MLNLVSLWVIRTYLETADLHYLYIYVHCSTTVLYNRLTYIFVHKILFKVAGVSGIAKHLITVF